MPSDDQQWIFNKGFDAHTVKHILNNEDCFVNGQTYKRNEIFTIARNRYKSRRYGTRLDDETMTKKERDKAVAVLKKQLPTKEEKNKNGFEWKARGYYLCTRSRKVESNTHIDNSDNCNNTDSATGNGLEPPDVAFGKGPCEVYAWSLPQDENPDTSWPIKIGFTGSGGFKKRWEGFRENLPVLPRYLIQVKFEKESQAQKIEHYLHDFFRNRDRQVKDIPATEWFLTNPDEIIEALTNLDPRLTQKRTAETVT